MEILEDDSKDGFNIRIDSFYFSSFMFFFSFESSKSNCHFNGFFIIIQSQVTMHDECAAHPREEKKYVRKRIKTEETSSLIFISRRCLSTPFHSQLSRLPRWPTRPVQCTNTELHHQQKENSSTATNNQLPVPSLVVLIRAKSNCSITSRSRKKSSNQAHWAFIHIPQQSIS